MATLRKLTQLNGEPILINMDAVEKIYAKNLVGEGKCSEIIMAQSSSALVKESFIELQENL